MKLAKVDKNETYFCEGEKESDTAGSREGVADLALDLLRTKIYILLKQNVKMIIWSWLNLRYLKQNNVLTTAKSRENVKVT